MRKDRKVIPVLDGSLMAVSLMSIQCFAANIIIHAKDVSKDSEFMIPTACAKKIKFCTLKIREMSII